MTIHISGLAVEVTEATLAERLALIEERAVIRRKLVSEMRPADYLRWREIDIALAESVDLI